MMFTLSTILTWVAVTIQYYGAAAIPTWPSSVDELEDIMLLNTGYRARAFATAVTPCSFSAAGPGRIAAAEWIRTAFHDMATGNVYTGAGGLDASLVFELGGGENIGSAFTTSLTTFAPFLSSRASMADIIAMGVYTAVRSCGGPVVPIKAGRIDATVAGPEGVPLPQNDIGTFKNQFLRTGFNTAEMIAVTACGHTIGGVHAVNFPDIVTAGSVADDYAKFDTTDVFDNRIATEYVAGTTKDPLVVGPSTKNGRNSDARVFAADSNVTIKAMTDATYFASQCAVMLQKMIEVVPAGTTLTDPITPYEVKPYALQLTLQDGGATILFTGDVRVRTTTRSAGQIAFVQLVYSDRTGAAVSTNIDTAYKGAASGFDDSFAFYGFSAQLSSSTSISSFNVLITLISGTTQLYDNNGSGFPISDNIMLQTPQSCVDSTGKLTVVAAVRNTVSSGVNLNAVLKVPRASGIPVPALSTVSASMATQSAVGSYNLYSATYSPASGKVSTFGVSAGSASDNYKDISSLPSACSTLNPSAPSSTPSSSAVAYQGCYTDSSASRAFTGATYYDNDMTVEKCTSDCSKFQYFGIEFGGECYCGNSRDSSSTLAAASECNVACPGNSAEYCGGANRLSVYKNMQYSAITNPNITGYIYQGCYSEASSGRALGDSSTASDTMTVEGCASFCNGAEYFGVEYGRECYCGANLASTSTTEPATDCSFTCAGSSKEFCGAGNRLNVYKKTSAASSSAASSSIPSSSRSSSIAASSSSSVPVSSSGSSSTLIISTTSISSSSSSTKLSDVISSSTAATSTVAPSSSTTPTPTPTLKPSSSSSSSSSTTSSTPSSTGPSWPGYTYQGCYIDSTNSRLLTSRSQSTGTNDYSTCSSFCSGYVYWGVEYGAECYCGNTLTSPATLASDPTDCSYSCSGNSSEVCGAGNRMNVFKSLTQTTGPANPSITGYQYVGCHTDAVGARVLDDKYLFDGSNMTIENCAGFCDGYTFFGTEYSGECYCGDTFANPTSNATESDCSYLCSGNKMEYCGAGGRLSMWQKLS